jgi:hypothetical protein
MTVDDYFNTDTLWIIREPGTKVSVALRFSTPRGAVGMRRGRAAGSANAPAAPQQVNTRT